MMGEGRMHYQDIASEGYWGVGQYCQQHYYWFWVQDIGMSTSFKFLYLQNRIMFPFHDETTLLTN